MKVLIQFDIKETRGNYGSWSYNTLVEQCISVTLSAGLPKTQLKDAGIC